MAACKAKDLIREIKARPGIYNKQKLKHPKRENKHKLWLEVTECLTPHHLWQEYTQQEKEAAIKEIQLKWKHVRDNFQRDIKLQLSSKTQEKRKYIHFDAMLFMLPFVDYKIRSANSLKGASNTSNNIDLNSSDEQTLNNRIQRTLHQLLHDSETEQRQENCNPGKAPLWDGEVNNVNTDLPTNKPPMSSPENASTTSVTASKCPTHPNAQIRDPDISFCLSLVPTLRKLTESQKLFAKIEILKVLHRIVAKHQATTTKRNTRRTNNNKDITQSASNSTKVPDQDPLNINAKESNIADENESEDSIKVWWT